MGLFRMIFAISVMINHSYPLFGYTLLGADIAVRSFFIVSGFYMGLILNEKYIKKRASYWLFLSNRLLRIYPLYLVTLLIISLFTIYWLQTGQEKFFVLFLRSIEGLPFQEKNASFSR
jgi:peptidoglycan/LPS O-acetylase OafA/YrhL